jgi:hypothetical protein
VFEALKLLVDEINTEDTKDRANFTGEEYVLTGTKLHSELFSLDVEYDVSLEEDKIVIKLGEKEFKIKYPLSMEDYGVAFNYSRKGKYVEALEVFMDINTLNIKELYTLSMYVPLILNVKLSGLKKKLKSSN